MPMSKVFFANSGSEANDTAIKLAWYYNNALGRPQKKKIIARQRAYHGVTLASASLTGLAANHRDFDLPLPASSTPTVRTTGAAPGRARARKTSPVASPRTSKR